MRKGNGERMGSQKILSRNISFSGPGSCWSFSVLLSPQKSPGLGVRGTGSLCWLCHSWLGDGQSLSSPSPLVYKMRDQQFRALFCSYNRPRRAATHEGPTPQRDARADFLMCLLPRLSVVGTQGRGLEDRKRSHGALLPQRGREGKMFVCASFQL